MKTSLICLLFLLFFAKGHTNPYPPRFEGIFEEYQYHPLDLVAQFIPENPIVFEAGAYDGTDSVIMSKKWPKGTIISFEPNPHAFEQYLKATQGLVNTVGYNLAVNNYNGKAILNVCYRSNGDNPVFEGASSLLESADWMKVNYQGPKVVIPCVTLDAFCVDNKIDHIDFLWLDLKGLELQVLQSSPKILAGVSVIYTETNFQKFRVGMTQYSDLKAFLTKAGFKLLSHWYADNFQGNAIFVRKEILETATLDVTLEGIAFDN